MNKEFLMTELIIVKKLFSPKFLPFLLGILSGFSVFYFLYFFGAYGIQEGVSYSGHSHLFRSISFGSITLAYITLFETWFKPKWVTDRVLYLVVWYTFVVFLGSQLIFLLFNYFWNWQEWNFEAYVLIIKEFPLMMVLPLSFYFVLQTISKPKATEGDYLLFQSENGKDQLKVRLQDFMYANSSENYITITYISNSASRQHLIRKPLKVLEQELRANPEIERTHRSYLVNRYNIQAVKQTKGKVFVEINGTSLPVSKQFHKQFLS